MRPDHQQLAQELLKQGLPISEVARTFNVHPATFYRIRHYQTGLKAGLVNVTPVIFAPLATVLLSGCYATVPPIAQGGPRDVALVTPYFDDQIKQRFPVGSDEKQLRAELHRESFKIRETIDPNLGYRYIATYQDSGVCKVVWTVRWNENQRKITNTTATYSQSCL